MWLDEDPAAIAKARSYARSWSSTNGLDGERARELELIVSELVTNAIQHGSPPYRIELKRSGGSLHGEVSDGSRTNPRLLPHPDERGGFGLRITDTIATRWGVSPAEDGKAVWFMLPWQ